MYIRMYASRYVSTYIIYMQTHSLTYTYTTYNTHRADDVVLVRILEELVLLDQAREFSNLHTR